MPVAPKTNRIHIIPTEFGPEPTTLLLDIVRVMPSSKAKTPCSL